MAVVSVAVQCYLFGSAEAVVVAGFDAEQGLMGQISLMLWRAYVANL